MLAPLALMLLLAGPDPRAEKVFAAVAEKGCPKLFGMLTEGFQKLAPVEGWPTWKKIFDPKDPVKERSAGVRAVLRLPPEHVGAFVYSNASYMVAGVMIEKASGLSWEAAMKQRLFAPLKMASCGFGPPASPGSVDQPWAHRFADGALKPIEPGPESDNPLGMGP